MEILMKPIGYISSNFNKKEDLPRQSTLNTYEKATIKLKEEYTKGLKGIKANDHIVILFNFHKSNKLPVQLISRKTKDKRGVFNTRSPNRPNGIGMSIVKVTQVNNDELEFQGVDMLDGTPVLDIKPYSTRLNPKDD